MNVNINQSNNGRGGSSKVVINNTSENTKKSWMDISTFWMTIITTALAIAAFFGISFLTEKQVRNSFVSSEISKEKPDSVAKKINELKLSMIKRDSIVAANERSKIRNKIQNATSKLSITGNNNQIGNNNKIHNGDIITNNNTFQGSLVQFMPSDQKDILYAIDTAYSKAGVKTRNKKFAILMDTPSNASDFSVGVMKFLKSEGYQLTGGGSGSSFGQKYHVEYADNQINITFGVL